MIPSTRSTAGTAEGFPGRLPPHPAADHVVRSLIAAARKAARSAAPTDGRAGSPRTGYDRAF